VRVAVVLKAAQDGGTLTEGVVQNILTSSPAHPRGIKVCLESGQVGRIRRVLARRTEVIGSGRHALGAQAIQSPPGPLPSLRGARFPRRGGVAGPRRASLSLGKKTRFAERPALSKSANFSPVSPT
jgi:uncharacterized repeat protein (TIGR03833 family)